ncbi:MAG: hypothetical protein AAF532_06050 [Planctomycetota bacterium]
MIRNVIGAATLAAVCAFGASADAGEIGRGRLASMGLGSARVMNEAAADQIRGKGGFAFGYSFAATRAFRTFRTGGGGPRFEGPPPSQTTVVGRAESFNTSVGFGQLFGAQGNISFANSPLGTFSAGGFSAGGGF